MSPASLPPRRTQALVSALVCIAVGALSLAAGCFTPYGTPARGIVAEEAPDPFDQDAFNFVVIGDWGRNGLFNQRTVGRAMGAYAARIRSRFTISTGDNFYTSGVRSTTDAKWRRSFENIYTAASLQRPWYVVLGNHDWLGSARAQVAYSEQSDRWRLPDFYHATEMTVDDSTEVLFVFLETMQLVETAERASRYPDSDVWDREAQLAWLDSTLAASDAEWKIVVGHHPVYVGSAKYPDNDALIRDVEPILEERGVHVYLSGHEHNLQHLRPDGGTVDYFVSGAGSLTRPVRVTHRTLFARRVPGFMAVSITADQLYVQAIGETGQVFYFTNIPRIEQFEKDPSLVPRPEAVVAPEDTVMTPADSVQEAEEEALEEQGAD